MRMNFGRLSVLAAAVLLCAPWSAAEDFEGDLYTLDTCPVSGEKLGGKGDPVKFVHEGREVRFCCAGCVDKFKKDPAGYWSKIDARMEEEQMERYPLDTCLISGEELDDSAVDVVANNRLLRFCCDKCAKEFEKEPAKYLAKLDAAVIAKQTAGYPFDTCMVAGEKFGEHGMGHGHDMVVANRLVKFCCQGCTGQFNENPVRFFSMLDSGKLDAKAEEGSGTKS